jgi:uncharacterized protein (DUF2236 family)
MAARRPPSSGTASRSRRDGASRRPAALRAPASHPPRDRGLFGPETLTWRINRENVLVLGGGAALILQVAHPLVAAGVAEHSNYREDPWGRLYRTLDLTTKIVFGSKEEAAEAAGRIWNVHGRVRGVTRENGGRYPKGTPYEARDPELLMWVHATLVHTALLVYDRYVRRLSPAERERYYEEQKLLGEQFGLPPERRPASYAEFLEYFDQMVGDELAVTDALRDVVDATLHPELPLLLRLPGWAAVQAHELVTTWLLPPRLRDELGLGWGRARERLLGASRPLVHALLTATPGVVREFPRARAADRRLEAA